MHLRTFGNALRFSQVDLYVVIYSIAVKDRTAVCENGDCLITYLTRRSQHVTDVARRVTVYGRRDKKGDNIRHT